MDKFIMAAREERLAENNWFTRSLRPPEEVSATPFQQKPFNDKTSANYFSKFDVKHYKYSVVSIALFHGHKLLFACSGTALPRGRERLRVTRFVTSARLITEFNKERTTDDNLRIEVRLPDNTVTDGFLGLFDGTIAIVSSLYPYVHPVSLDLSKDERTCTPTRLIAAGLEAKEGTSLMVTSVRHRTGQKRPRRPRGPTLVSVTCDITEAGLGGPVIAVSTKFEFLAGVIISYDFKSKVANYLPTKALRRLLRHFQILTDKAISFRGYSVPPGVQCVIPSGLWASVQRFISLGYPPPPPPPPPLVCEFNGTLVNTFEEDFGRLVAWKGYPLGVDQRGRGDNVWEELPEEVVMSVSGSVVSLASYKGDMRCFACSGLLIKWQGSRETQVVVLTSASLVRTNGDKIDENLSIKVSLPPKQLVEGKLELYHQNYNIAIVSVRSHLDAISPQDIFRELTNPKSPQVVVAIGRNPREGLLMASKGKLEPPSKQCKLKCRALKLSTCQIKKAGIGGPLIDHNGSFIGMNFYDGNKTTPFLRRTTIINVLKKVIDLPSNSGLTGAMSMMDKDANKNWWPVPEAYWYHGELEMDKSVIPWNIKRVCY